MSKFSMPAPNPTEKQVKQEANLGKKQEKWIRSADHLSPEIGLEPSPSTKSLTIEIYESDLALINAIRARMPKQAGRKLAISLKGYILEALSERMQKDRAKYGV